MTSRDTDLLTEEETHTEAVFSVHMGISVPRNVSTELCLGAWKRGGSGGQEPGPKGKEESSW